MSTSVFLAFILVILTGTAEGICTSQNWVTYCCCIGHITVVNGDCSCSTGRVRTPESLIDVLIRSLSHVLEIVLLISRLLRTGLHHLPPL